MDEDAVVVRRQDWDAVLRRLSALEALVDRPPTTAVAPPSPDVVVSSPQRSDADDIVEDARPGAVTRRRALLGLAGAAGAGVAAAVATSSPAAAANGDPLIVGSSSNASTGSTVHTVTGSGTYYGLAAVDHAIPASAVYSAILGSATGQSFKTAVRAVATGTATGVRASSATGVAVEAISAGGTGLDAQGVGNGMKATTYTYGGYGVNAYAVQGVAVAAVGRDSLLLSGTVTEAPPSRDGSAFRGAVAVDGAGDVWYCVVAGTPGTWRKFSGLSTAGALHVLPAPKRVYDSRPGTLPAVGTKAPFAPGNTRSFDLKVNSSGVPAGATAALVTILLVNAANVSGNLTLWANGVTKPQSNTMVWGGAAGRFTATAVTALDSLARCQVNASARTDLVLDVVGYYR